MKHDWGERGVDFERYNLMPVAIVAVRGRAVWVKVGTVCYRATKRAASVSILRDYIRLGQRTFWLFMADCARSVWYDGRCEFAITAAEAERLQQHMAENANYEAYRKARWHDGRLAAVHHRGQRGA